MLNIRAIFTEMTRHPTHATTSCIFLNVHLSYNVSNWWTTFLCSSHGRIRNHLWTYIIGPILLVVNHVEIDVVYIIYTLIPKLLIDKYFIVVTKARTCNNDMRTWEM